MSFTRNITLPATTALTIIFSSPAFALDATDFMAKANAAFAAQGGQLTAAETIVEGSNITAKGVIFTPGGGNDKKVPVGNVEFEGIEEANGGYIVSTVRFDDIDTTNDGVHMVIKDIEIDGLRLPAETGTGKLNSVMLYDRFYAGPITVEQAGKWNAAISSIEGKADIAGDESKIGFDAKISGIKADLPPPPPKSKAMIEALNLQHISGDVVMSGAWEVASGKVDINEYSLDFDDIGKLNIKASISGYTADFVKALQEAQAAMAANPDKKAANQTFGLAMMGLMQQLSFNGASIRFDDASITSRVLDAVGQQQGVSGEQMAQSLKGMAPLMLARLNMPQLQAQISEALSAYLDNPQSIEIKAQPLNPVAVPAIMGAAMGAPQTLPDVLGVTVAANE